MFSEFFPIQWVSREPRPDVHWIPPVEPIDKKNHLLFRAEVSGIKKEDLSIPVEGDNLSIKGEVKSEAEEEREHFYCCELVYDTFGRLIRLPSELQTNRVEASLFDGILETKHLNPRP